jgi:hypothetical protein
MTVRTYAQCGWAEARQGQSRSGSGFDRISRRATNDTGPMTKDQ